MIAAKASFPTCYASCVSCICLQVAKFTYVPFDISPSFKLEGPEYYSVDRRSEYECKMEFDFDNIVTDCTCKCDEVLEAVTSLPSLQKLTLLRLDLRDGFAIILNNLNGLLSLDLNSCILPDDFVQLLQDAQLRNKATPLLQNFKIYECYDRAGVVSCKRAMLAAGWDAASFQRKRHSRAIEDDWRVTPTVWDSQWDGFI